MSASRRPARFQCEAPDSLRRDDYKSMKIHVSRNGIEGTTDYSEHCLKRALGLVVGQTDTSWSQAKPVAVETVIVASLDHGA